MNLAKEKELLEEVKKLLTKQEEANIVLNLLETTYVYKSRKPRNGADLRKNIEDNKPIQIKTRGQELLSLFNELMKRQDEVHYVINVLEETLEYDGTTCDGFCLLEDIENELGKIKQKSEKKKKKHLKYNIFDK